VTAAVKNVVYIVGKPKDNASPRVVDRRRIEEAIRNTAAYQKKHD